MITDEIMESIDMLIEICSNKEQVKGMKSVREMLADFDESVWINTKNPSDRHEWLSQYLSCKPNE